MKKSLGLLLVFGLLGANILVWPYVLHGTSLQVTFLNVGQGDAIFMQTPQGHQMLIDGGPDDTVVERLEEVLPFWDTSLDAIILTHADADHITGLVPVLKKYQVKNVLWTGVTKDTNVFASWENAVKEEGARVYVVSSPQKILWSLAAPNEYIQVLYPGKGDTQSGKPVNDTSLVTKLVFKDNTFLFTGDISSKVELELVKNNINVTADVLKIPHHGSKSSSSGVFLAAVQPEFGVIQVGKENRYGHPTPEVLERLGAISVLRTDILGNITIRSNGEKFSIQYNN